MRHDKIGNKRKQGEEIPERYTVRTWSRSRLHADSHGDDLRAAFSEADTRMSKHASDGAIVVILDWRSIHPSAPLFHWVAGDPRPEIAH